MDEKDKQTGTDIPLKRTIMWNLMIQSGDQPKEGSFVGVKTVDDLIHKRSNLSLVEETLTRDLKALQDIVNSDLPDVPDNIKEAILALFQDAISVTTGGKSKMIIQKPRSM
jgi:hypothetical protein